MAILFFVCHGNAVRPGRKEEVKAQSREYNDLVTLGEGVELRRCQMNGKFLKMRGTAFENPFDNVHKNINGPKKLFEQVISGSGYFGPNSVLLEELRRQNPIQPPQQQQYRNVEIFIGPDPGFLGIYEWDGTYIKKYNKNGVVFYLDDFQVKNYNQIKKFVLNDNYEYSYQYELKGTST